MPKVTTRPAPQPLPPAWARAVANSITRRLRRPWSPSRATRDLTNARASGYSTASSVGTPHPTVEVLFNQPYAVGTVPPNTRTGQPRLVWHLRATAAIGSIPEEHRDAVEAYLRRPAAPGPAPEPFRVADDTLRRAESTSTEIALLMVRVAEAATVLEVDDAEFERAVALLEWEAAEQEMSRIIMRGLDKLPELSLIL